MIYLENFENVENTSEFDLKMTENFVVKPLGESVNKLTTLLEEAKDLSELQNSNIKKEIKEVLIKKIKDISIINNDIKSNNKLNKLDSIRHQRDLELLDNNSKNNDLLDNYKIVRQMFNDAKQEHEKNKKIKLFQSLKPNIRNENIISNLTPKAQVEQQQLRENFNLNELEQEKSLHDVDFFAALESGQNKQSSNEEDKFENLVKDNDAFGNDIRENKKIIKTIELQRDIDQKELRELMKNDQIEEGKSIHQIDFFTALDSAENKQANRNALKFEKKVLNSEAFGFDDEVETIKKIEKKAARDQKVLQDMFNLYDEDKGVKMKDINYFDSNKNIRPEEAAKFIERLEAKEKIAGKLSQSYFNKIYNNVQKEQKHLRENFDIMIENKSKNPNNNIDFFDIKQPKEEKDLEIINFREIGEKEEKRESNENYLKKLKKKTENEQSKLQEIFNLYDEEKSEGIKIPD
jgi:hypothetical protein